jgi:hypothetical protein
MAEEERAGISGNGGRKDPTPNVSDIIHAESKYQDGMREAGDKQGQSAREAMTTFQNFARESESRMQTWMRDAESKRVDQLTSQRQVYEAQIANMLSASVIEKSNLVATQLLQIQSSFGERVSKLEEFRLLSTGRSSVADPQLAASLDMINKNLASTQDQFAKTLAELSGKQTEAMSTLARNVTVLQETGTSSSGKDTGRREVFAWIITAVTLSAMIAGALTQIIAHMG